VVLSFDVLQDTKYLNEALNEYVVSTKLFEFPPKFEPISAKPYASLTFSYISRYL